MKLKIAFHVLGDAGWIFGRVYLRGLLAALRARYGGEMGLYLLAPEGQNGAADFSRAAGADALLEYRTHRPWTAPWAVDRAAQRLLARDLGKENVLRAQGIQALFGLQLAFEAPKVATLSLIPDFQHVHLPEMFSRAEIEFREQIFRETARRATRVIVFGETVRKDFEAFAPRHAEKARALPPISFVPEAIYEEPIAPLLERLHLPEKFIYLPNQFWKHKNHAAAFQAVKILRGRGVDVALVCSGFPGDYRHPEYFGEVWQKLSEWDVRGQVIFIGQVAHEDVLRLMRQSVCVLNPSRFEGWGITVDEARSVGKQVVLSDIPAHREQNPPRATYFDPNNAEDLAQKLGAVWRETPAGPDLALESEARQAQPGRVRGYAEAFAAVAREAVANG
ncbi:MAG: glycosyltransferase family 4 protein [Acidobacteria bacterium]|nr:glycosyltransferase family 4 protein [Acidobacteriota bacterium]